MRGPKVSFLSVSFWQQRFLFTRSFRGAVNIRTLLRFDFALLFSYLGTAVALGRKANLESHPSAGAFLR